MKRINKLNLGLTLILLAGMMAACVKGDYDTPPINVPTVDFSANYTILKLKQTYTTLDSIEGDTIIKGVIIGNDESGNIYKKLIIQDGTSGIEVNIDRTNMYTEYRLGQRVLIKCKGMYIGDYNGLIQIGYKYNGGIGQLPSILVADHIFKDSLPGKTPEPVTMSIPTTINSSNAAKVSTLVKFENVQFVEAGQEYCPQSVSSAINRTLKDDNGKTIVVRNSKYASFASVLMPKGTGTVVGILSVFGGTPQLTLRDTSDIYGFTTAGGNLLDEDFTTTLGSFSAFSVQGDAKWEWSSYGSGCAKMTGFVGNNNLPNEDWLISPVVNLTGHTGTKLNISQAANYINNHWDYMKVLVSSDYDGSSNPATQGHWTEITVTNKPTGWTFVDSGDLDLSAFDGQSNVHIAFKYVSTSSVASTWEVGSVRVK